MSKNDLKNSGLVKVSSLPLTLRAVKPLQVVPSEIQAPQAATLVAYKDLNESVQLQLQKQKQQFFFALSVFVFLGLFMLAFEVIKKPRNVASNFGATTALIEGTPIVEEHYQYDKSCYQGEKGERICMTRTSRK